jgi:hypothetical protein
MDEVAEKFAVVAYFMLMARVLIQLMGYLRSSRRKMKG